MHRAAPWHIQTLFEPHADYPSLCLPLNMSVWFSSLHACLQVFFFLSLFQKTSREALLRVLALVLPSRLPGLAHPPAEELRYFIDRSIAKYQAKVGVSDWCFGVGVCWLRRVGCHIICEWVAPVRLFTAVYCV